MSENKSQSPQESSSTVTGEKDYEFADHSNPLLKESVGLWQTVHQDYHFENITQNTEIQKNDEHAPDLPREFIDFLVGIAKKRISVGALENIQKVTVYHGGGKILLGLKTKEQPKLTHFWFELDPPFEIYNISQ